MSERQLTLDSQYVPHVKRSDTSRASADQLKPVVRGVRKQVFDAVKEAGPDGMTTDEVEVKLNMRHQTASSQMTYMSKTMTSPVLFDSNNRRQTRSGRYAAVLVADPQWIVKKANE